MNGIWWARMCATHLGDNQWMDMLSDEESQSLFMPFVLLHPSAPSIHCLSSTSLRSHTHTHFPPRPINHSQVARRNVAMFYYETERSKPKTKHRKTVTHDQNTPTQIQIRTMAVILNPIMWKKKKKNNNNKKHRKTPPDHKTKLNNSEFTKCIVSIHFYCKIKLQHWVTGGISDFWCHQTKTFHHQSFN